MIRPAGPEDAQAVDRVHVRAWERAYADFVPPDRMVGAAEPEEREARWRGRIADPEVGTWVLDLDGFVAGFACVRGDELLALYVDPGAQGAGVGTQLLAHAEALMREAGTARAHLWVLVPNEHGRRFYEAHGWSLVEGSEDPQGLPVPGVKYEKAL